MVKYRLHYFDFKGKGELARLVFAAAGQEYEDKRYEYSQTNEEWVQFKPKTPFGKLPVLEIINEENNTVVNRLAQSVTIGRYLGNEFGLNGKTNFERAQADSYADQISDLSIKVIDYLVASDADKLKAIVAELDSNILPANFKFFEDKINQNSNGYLIGDSLTWTDLYLLSIIDWFDDEYKERILNKYQTIKKHYELVKSNINVAAWINKRPVTKY